MKSGLSSSKLKHVQLRDTLLKKIRRSEYPLHSKLPRVVDISEQFGVSYVTALRAVRALADGGVLVQSKHVGATVIRTSLVQDRSHLIVGCVIRPLRAWNEMDNFALRMIEAAYLELSAQHAGTAHSALPTVDASSIPTLRDAIRRRRLGAIVADQLVADEDLRKLVNSGCPAVVFNRHTRLANVDSIAADMNWMGEKLARAIIKSGYRRVVICHVPRPEYHDSPFRRAAISQETTYCTAVQQSLAEAGFTEKQVLMAYEPPREESSLWENDDYFCRSQFISDRPGGDRTAYVTHSDVHGLRVARVLRKRGYVLPRDAGVAGLFNLECNRNPASAITTWEIDPVAIGRGAIELLMERVLDPSRECERRSVKGVWVDRGTF